MRFALVMALTGLCQISFAAEPKGYLITTSFEYQIANKTTKSESTIILDMENPQRWNTLVPPRNGVSLLGKLVAIEGDSLTMEYLVVDANRGDAIISSPSIVATVGKEATTETASKSERVLVGIKAIPTKTR